MRIRTLTLGMILAGALGATGAEAGCRPVRHVACDCPPAHARVVEHHRMAKHFAAPPIREDYAPRRTAESYYDYRSSSRVTISEHHSNWRAAPNDWNSSQYDDGAGYGQSGGYQQGYDQAGYGSQRFVDGYGEAHYDDGLGYASGGYDDGDGIRGVPYANYDGGYQDPYQDSGVYGGQRYYGGNHGLHGEIGADAHVGPLHAGVHMGGHIGASIGSGIGANVGIGPLDIGAHVGSSAGFR